MLIGRHVLLATIEHRGNEKHLLHDIGGQHLMEGLSPFDFILGGNQNQLVFGAGLVVRLEQPEELRFVGG